MGCRTAASHCYAGTLELLADCAPVDAQLGTGLAECPAFGVQVGCTLNVHRDTVTRKHWHRSPLLRSFAQPPQYFC
jgi:hypothetical protein